MRLSKNDLLEKVKAYIGEDTSDESISLIEDVSDSIDEENMNWKDRYEENDKNWRKKYTERFYGKIPEIEEEDPEPKKKTRFEDLFEEVR